MGTDLIFMTGTRNMKITENSLNLTYILVGNGRLARHLSYYFDQLHIPFIQWDRSQSEPLLKGLLSQPRKVLLAISDKALMEFYHRHLVNTPHQTVHFSGAFHHPAMISCHPLMSFSDTLFDLKTYQSLHWAITGAASLQSILPELPNPSFVLDEKNKPLYHAWCVLSAAGAQTIWKSALQQLKSIGVKEEGALIYIQQISKNFLTSPENSLTGPWVRQDQETIQRNLRALPPAAAKVYEDLMKGLL